MGGGREEGERREERGRRGEGGKEEERRRMAIKRKGKREWRQVKIEITVQLSS